MATIGVHQSYPGFSPGLRLMDLETRVGEDALTPGFKKHLENYYIKASPADQARCLELLTSINLGETIAASQPHSFNYKNPRRCRTAMASVGKQQSDDVFGAFKTTYKRDFSTKPGLSAKANRPSSSNGFTASHDLDGPVGSSHYMDEFHDKTTRPSSPIRAGSSSGTRNNKPHPLQAFMVWRFPSRPIKQTLPRWSEELTNEKINQIHKRLCASTYQMDYNENIRALQAKLAPKELPPDWKGNVPYSLDSYTRASYQRPNQQAELALPTSRYGSNKKKQMTAVGSIPTVNRYLMNLKTKTTYERHFNDNASAVTQQIRDVSHRLNADQLRRVYNQVSGDEKEVLGKMLESLGDAPPDHNVQHEAPVPRPPPSAGSRHARPSSNLSWRPRATPPSTRISVYGSGHKLAHTPPPFSPLAQQGRPIDSSGIS